MRDGALLTVLYVSLYISQHERTGREHEVSVQNIRTELESGLTTIKHVRNYI